MASCTKFSADLIINTYKLPAPAAKNDISLKSLERPLKRARAHEVFSAAIVRRSPSSFSICSDASSEASEPSVMAMAPGTGAPKRRSSSKPQRPPAPLTILKPL